MFIVLLSSMVNASSHTKCIYLSNHKCKIQPALISFYPNECSQQFHYYPFMVKLDRSVGSCNTLNDLSNKVYVPNKTEDLNLSMFNMITGINESQALTKYNSCKYKCKFDERKCNSQQWWNNNKCWCECKNHHICEKDYICNPAPYACENWKYLASIMDDSVITCDEVLESYNEKTIEIKESNFISTSPFVLLATRIECYSVCIIKPFYYL